MNKKGFTLVELLAVIAILAILVIIAMPNVLQMFNKAKQDAFETEVKTHVKAVSNQFITTGKLVYSNVVDGAAKLPMDGEELDYYIELDSQGNIKELNVTNGDYKIEATGTSQNPIKVEQIGNTIKSETAQSGEEFAMNSSGKISDGKITFYNKKFFIGGLGGTYIVIDNNNMMSVYDSNGNLLQKDSVEINNGVLTLINNGEYNGTYTLSGDGHEILVKEVNSVPNGYTIAVEDGYCTHIKSYNSNGGAWITVEIDSNNKPVLICDTCGKRAYDYKLIDGVLYTKNIYIGDGSYVADSEYNERFFSGYNALIWDKTLDTIKIKSKIDGIKVTFFNGHQTRTDKEAVVSRNWEFEGTMSEWNSIQNNFYGYSYAYEGLKVKCSDGTINY